MSNMDFDPAQFQAFLRELTRTREQVADILQSSPGADALSEAAMILAFQSLFDVLMTQREPSDRIELTGKLKDLVAALNTRRDIERKAQLHQPESAKSPLDAAGMTDLSQKLKLL